MATVVQAASLYSSSFTSSFNVSISAVTSGNAVIVCSLVPVGQSFSSITDNGGASPTYNVDYSDTTFRASNIQVHVASRASITDAPTQITVNYGGNVFQPVILVLEVSDFSAFGQSGAGTSSTTDAPTASVTTTVANELGICFAAVGSDRTWTDPSAGSLTWTRAPAGSDPDPYALWYIADLGAAGSKTADPTYTTATSSQCGMVTYEPSGGGSSTILPLLNAYYS